MESMTLESRDLKRIGWTSYVSISLMYLFNNTGGV
jgi:hypothetical protein